MESVGNADIEIADVREDVVQAVGLKNASAE